MRLLLIMILLFVPTSTAVPQGEVYTWGTYNFAFSLPDSWTAAEDGDSRLVLGVPDDVNRVLAGELASGLVVDVRVVPPPLEELRGRNAIEDFVASNRGLTLDDRTYGSRTLPTVDMPPVGGRRTRLVLVADTFLITASAPASLWEETFPILDALLASIEAQPVSPPNPLPLTQHFTWRDISFDVPSDWFMGSMGNNLSMVSMTNANRIFGGATFQYLQLVITVQDHSYIRSALSPDSLPGLEAPFYEPDGALGNPIRQDVNGIPAASVEFVSGVGRGKAVLLLSPRSAYLFVGFSDADTWAKSEGALFESVLATVHLE